MAADHENHPAKSGTHHYHPASVKYRTYFLFGFRTVLSGAYEFRSSFPTTNVIDTYVYRALIERGNISMSSAAGVYQSIVGFAIVMLSNWVVRKVDKEQALF